MPWGERERGCGEVDQPGCGEVDQPGWGSGGLWAEGVGWAGHLDNSYRGQCVQDKLHFNFEKFSQPNISTLKARCSVFPHRRLSASQSETMQYLYISLVCLQM